MIVKHPTRFALVALILAAALSILASKAAGQSEVATDLAARTGQDWPNFLGPDRNNKSCAQGLRLDGKSLELPVLWSTDLGAGYAACSVSQGRCFVFDRIQDTARLRCLNAESGVQLWEFEYATDYVDMYDFNNGPRCTPIVDGNRVFIYGAEGELHCVNVADGEKKWSYDVNEELDVVQNFFGVGSTPIVFENLLLVMAGGSPPESLQIPPGQLDRVTPNGSCLVAFNKLTGAIVYKSGDDLASYASLQIASVNNKPTGILFARAGLRTFNPQSGKMNLFFPWRANSLESVNASTPVVVDDGVFITESYEPGGALLRIRDTEFEVAWKDVPKSRDQAFAAHWMTPIFHEGCLYGCSGQRPSEANLRCIEWATGKLRWEKKSTGRVSLLYVDGHFLCLSENGEMKIISANSDEYHEVCSVGLSKAEGPDDSLINYPAWAAPVLARGLLYVRGDSRLVCAELLKQSKPASP